LTQSDEGISGKNIIERPAVNRLIEDIKNKQVNNVLVFKVDRLTRSTKNLTELMELFDKYNCAFNSLTESIDTETPSGRMFLKIIGIFAEFERENISIRTKLGFERKVKEGYTLANFSLSYGYIKKKGEKVQTIQQDEAKVVREIFDMYVNKNIEFNKIAKSLNERKIKTKRSGMVWDGSKIKVLLTNPTYIGKVRYSCFNDNKYFETEGHHEPIISEELFMYAQEKIKNMPKLYKTKRPKEDSYFCGVLFCGKCGGKFTTHHYSCKTDNNGKKQYRNSYRCNNKNYFNKDNTCTSSDIIHAKVEKAFCEYIEKIDIFSEIENLNIESDKDIEKEKNSKNIISCQNKINNFQKKKQQILEQYVSEEMTFAEYKEMLKVLNEKCDVLELELENMKSIISEKSEEIISKEDIILDIKENWTYLNNSEKMMFLQKFVKKIVMTVEKYNKNFCTAVIQSVEFN